VRAVDGNDAEAVSGAIAAADIMATAVGANILKFIAPNIAAGLRLRFGASARPLDILICENLMDADKVFADLIKGSLAGGEQALFDERVGMVEASIGRMVPVQTAEMKDGDPLRVCVEQYGFLPVDKDAFKGDIPKIKGLFPYSPFGLYLRRKLYVHNLGHAVCAFLGLFTGETYIHEAMDNSDIQLLAKNAMLESAEALAAEYGAPAAELLRHIDDLLHRFANRALGDTCARVGADTGRKLGPSDRLIGAAHFCLAHGVMPVYISVGAAAALHRHLLDSHLAQTGENADMALREVAGLGDDHKIASLIKEAYQDFKNGTNTRRLRRGAESRKARHMPGAV
jgi:mannitol-1-phosphate 5-dehydrogenase